jgi:hypothetical protein
VGKNEPWIKRPRTSSAAGGSKANPVRYWIQEGSWPKEYFEQGSSMSEMPGKKRSASSMQNSVTSNTTFREGKNPATRDRLYEKTLAEAKIYMDEDDQITPTDACTALCQTLLDATQSTPKGTLFGDDHFKSTCLRLRNQNEAMVFQDLFPLIVPRAEILHEFGAENLKHLTGNINQKWYGCVPMVSGPHPQPDYAVGFKESAFSQSQLERLGPFIQGWKGTPFLATAWMYFPFLTCEVKCGNEALDIADRQNAHSGSVAVKQLIDLYREVSLERELHQEILAFSVSHDHRSVRIYGHYALVNGDITCLHRHLIRSFDFVEQDGRDKWTSYKFILNVYNTFVPTLFERICTAIDLLPDPNPQPSRQSLGESVPQLVPNDSQSTSAGSPYTGPIIPSSRTSEPSFKKPKIKGSSTASTGTGTRSQQN